MAGCSNGYIFHGSHCYKFVNQKTVWNQAETRCKAEGGHLASVKSESTWNFLKSFSRERLWIGGYCSDRSHDRCKQADMAYWHWTDGSPFTSAFMKWYSNEPDTYQGIQDKLFMNHVAHGSWADESEAAQLPFICQANPSGTYISVCPLI